MLLVDHFLPRRILATKRKERHALKYWLKRKAAEGTLTNGHYQAFYTSHFDLAPEFYADKRILDIGCGPRGSLEWADMARERIGLDPLAKKYLELGADKHRMTYVPGYAESMSFADDHFDVVSSFNSLDHVDRLGPTLSELARVLKPGGLLLLLTDLNHAPTKREPQTFSWAVTQELRRHFEIRDERHFEKKGSGIYDSIRQNIPYDHDDPSPRYGILSLKAQKPAAA